MRPPQWPVLTRRPPRSTRSLNHFPLFPPEIDARLITSRFGVLALPTNAPRLRSAALHNPSAPLSSEGRLVRNRPFVHSARFFGHTGASWSCRLGRYDDRHSGNFAAVFVDSINVEPVVLVTVFGQLSGDHGRVKPRCQGVWQDGAYFVLDRLSVARDMKEVQHFLSFSYWYRKGMLIPFPTPKSAVSV